MFTYSTTTETPTRCATRPFAVKCDQTGVFKSYHETLEAARKNARRRNCAARVVKGIKA
jgi:hypothetical protein